MYDDYLKQRRYVEQERSFSKFPSANRMLQEKDFYQRRRRKRRRSGNRLIYNNLATKQRNTNALGKQIIGLNQQNSLISKNCNNLAGGIDKILKYAILIGISLLGLKKYLNNLDFQKGIYGGGLEDSYQGMSSGKTSDKGIHALLNYEGFIPVAKDIEGKGILTIGYGHRGKDVKPGQTITREAALQLFKSDLKPRENLVNKLVKVPLSQNMFDALVSFVYNCGSGNFAKSDTLKLINQGKYREAAERMKTEYINPGTKHEQGLRNRRAKEAALILGDLDVNGQIKKDVQIANPPVDVGKTVSKSMSDISKKSYTNNGVTYDKSSNITSHTLLKDSTNKYYNANAGGMGTYMGKQITSGIGHRQSDGSSFHRGLDLAYAYGTPVYAFCSGTVTHAGLMEGFGRLVIVNDEKGYRHIYGHLSKICVQNKQKVTKDVTLLGYSGGSSCVNGKLIERKFAPHLHYGIWKPGGTSDRTDYIDPRTYTYPQDAQSNPSSVVNNEYAKKLKKQQEELKKQEKEKKEKEKKAAEEKAKKEKQKKATTAIVHSSNNYKNNTTLKNTGVVSPKDKIKQQNKDYVRERK